MGSDNYSGEGRGADSPSESRGGPGAGAGSSSSGGSKGSSSSGGGLNSAGNRASGAGPGASSNRSTSSGGGGLNSAGDRASGAGPGASSNRSTTGGGFGGTSGGMGGNSNSMGGGNGNGGLNSAGNRASGAGPGASSNRSTTGGGYGSNSSLGGQNSPRGIGGGMVSDVARRADLAQSARASENASMSTYNAARSLSQQNAQRAGMAQQARTAEEQSMNSMADWGKEVKSVVAAGPGWTEVELNNGLKERRQGDRASRNNNPGNIRDGQWAKSQPGYAGTDGSFAVFSSKEDGINAIGSLLGKSSYMSKTVEGAISSYAPPNENNTASYVSRVASAIGASKDTPMSSLTAAQRDAMARAITGVEGNTGYAVAKTTGTDRFASTYLGGKTSTGSTAERNAAATQEAAKAQQNDPTGLPPGTYRGYYPGGAPDYSSFPKATAPTAPAPRSLGQKVAAAGIDVGLGMLPTVGTAVSVINGGLALTGNKTLGERAVDSFVNGKGGAGPDSGRDRPGSSGQIVDNSKSTVPKQSQESFEDRYLKFVDPTPRPTPAERWDYSQSGYS